MGKASIAHPLSSGRSLGVSAYGDPYERPLSWLMEKRAKLATARSRREIRAARRSITHWRQVITVSVATRRAEAGDQVAKRRLAWRKTVLDFRRRAEWLSERFRAWDAQMRNLARQGTAECSCVGCVKRIDRARRNRDEFLAEIAALPDTAPPNYYEYARRQTAEAAAADAWLRRQLDGLTPDGGA